LEVSIMADYDDEFRYEEDDDGDEEIDETVSVAHDVTCIRQN